MKKMQQLREHLISSISQLQTNPDQLEMKVTAGTPACGMGTNLNIEYRYTTQLTIYDFSHDVDIVMIPLLIWLSEHQSELLVDPNKAKTSINIEMDVIDNSKADVRITFPLTERHLVKAIDGKLQVEVPAEPQYDAFWPQQSLTLEDQDGTPLVTFTTADEQGSALTMPFPTKR